ncbi:MAG: anti-sigma factor protein [Clostridia bacterium]|jgi:hypothetical protein|nr:anti-sigma factor protein [Clostridia bacterium]
MIYKGQVIDINKNYAIVLTEDMEYKRVVKKQKMCIGMPILFLKEDIYVNHKVNLKALYGIAAVFIFIFFSVGMFGRLNDVENITASIVSIDINPSVELGVSPKGLVTEIKSLNEEGSSILKDIPMGLELSDTVICILNNAYTAHYLDQEDSTILIAFAALNQNSSTTLMHQQEKVKNSINKHAQYKNTTIEYIFTEKNSIESARENDISIGRYGLYENLRAENQSITVTGIKKMNISELLRQRNGRNHETVGNENEMEEDWPMQYRHGFEDEDDAEEILAPHDNETGDTNNRSKQRVRKGSENQSIQTPIGSEEQTSQEFVQPEEIVEEYEGQSEEVLVPEDNGQIPIEDGAGHEGVNSNGEQDQNRESDMSEDKDNKGDCKNPDKNMNKK